MNTPYTATHVFYSASQNCIIDTCTDENPPRSHINGWTLEEMQARYPDAVYVEFEATYKAMEERHKRPVQEITKEYWWEMLEVLPPMMWINDGNGESFKMSERWSGNITDIYARIGDRYFALRDTQFLPHDEIMRRCNKFMQGE